MNTQPPSIFIDLSGQRTLPSPGPKPSWERSRGDGYCRMRSAQFGRRMGHLFIAWMGVGGIVSNHCSWCWKRQE